MQNNIKEDLIFFNELINELIDDELKNPISTSILPENLYSEFDLQLKSTPAIPKEFKKSLKKSMNKTEILELEKACSAI